MNVKVRNLFIMLISIFIELILYIFLHESGHALVSLACGAKITAFSIIGAYTSSIGGTFNVVTSSLNSAAGMLLPVLVSFFYMLFYRKECGNVYYVFFSFYFVIASSGSILAWIIVPLTYLAGNAPVADDVTKFLSVSGISPILVMIFAFLLFAISILLAFKKGIFKNWWQLIHSY